MMADMMMTPRSMGMGWVGGAKMVGGGCFFGRSLLIFSRLAACPHLSSKPLESTVNDEVSRSNRSQVTPQNWSLLVILVILGYFGLLIL